MTKLPDPKAAHAYFSNKNAFTAGPVELDHMRKNRDVVVVDVRAADDYAKGHVPGAVSLPKNAWATADGLEKDKLNVFYCYSQVCHLASKAAAQFAAEGFPVMELEGGFKAWQEHELEVETSAAAAAEADDTPRVKQAPKDFPQTGFEPAY